MFAMRTVDAAQIALAPPSLPPARLCPYFALYAARELRQRARPASDA